MPSTLSPFILRLVLPEAVEPHIFTLEKPQRIIIDLKPFKGTGRKTYRLKNNAFLQHLRSGSHSLNHFRLVGELKVPVQWQIKHRKIAHNQVQWLIFISHKKNKTTTFTLCAPASPSSA